MTTDMLAPVAVHALRNAMQARLLVNYRRELAAEVCPCNNTDTMCPDCREAFHSAQARREQGLAGWIRDAASVGVVARVREVTP